MKILDGKKTSKKIISNIKSEVSKIEGFRNPKMNVILVGNSPASEIYVKHKLKASKESEIESELIRFDETDK